MRSLSRLEVPHLVPDSREAVHIPHGCRGFRHIVAALVTGLLLPTPLTTAGAQTPQRTSRETTARTCYSMPPSRASQPITPPESTEAAKWAARAVGLDQSHSPRAVSYLVVKDEGILIRVAPPDSMTLDAGGLVWIGTDRCVIVVRK